MGCSVVGNGKVLCYVHLLDLVSSATRAVIVDGQAVQQPSGYLIAGQMDHQLWNELENSAAAIYWRQAMEERSLSLGVELECGASWQAGHLLRRTSCDLMKMKGEI